MDPLIEEIVSKWASLAIQHLVQVAYQKQESVDITFILKQICEKNKINIKSLDCRAWKHINLPLPNEKGYMKSGAFLPIYEAESDILNFLTRCSLLLLQLVSTQPNDPRKQRLLKYKLYDFLAICTNFPPKSSIWNTACRALTKDQFFIPSDFTHPQRLVKGIVDQVIGKGYFHGVGAEYELEMSKEMSCLSSIAHVFSHDRTKADSKWNSYFINIEKELMKTTKQGTKSMYTELLTPTSEFAKMSFTIADKIGIAPLKNSQISSSSNELETLAESGNTASMKPNSTWLHPSLNSYLQLRVCHNGHCDKVELKRGDFKMCSRCRKVWYCGKECQASDWKKHKIDCQAV